MNAVGSLWKEAKAADGRTYYYNTQTQATQWSKPDDYATPTPTGPVADQKRGTWREAKSAEGKVYWYNDVTMATTWNMPEELKQGQGPPSLPAKPVAPTFVAGGAHAMHDGGRDRHRDGDDYMPSHQRDRDQDNRHDRRPYGHNQDGFRTTTALSVQESEYSNPQEAEAAFFKALKRAGAQADWTWEQAMRGAIKDPQYHAIKNAKERKMAFAKYIEEMRSQEHEKEKERKVKLRTDFTTMLKSHPDIKYYTRWRTARPIIEGETIFRSAQTEEEALALFEEHRAELYKQHLEQQSQDRKDALAELEHILSSLDLAPYTRWSSAQTAIVESDRIQSDAKFKSLTKLDFLKAFEKHIKSLERAFVDKQQHEKHVKYRTERQHRDDYVHLLRDLQRAGTINAGTKWEDIVNLIEDDPRYVNMLGQVGSSPLEMFWDILEECEKTLKKQKDHVLDVLEAKRFEITLRTTLKEYEDVMKTDDRTARIDSSTLKVIFERLREKIFKRSDTRRAVEALRSRMKHLEPPVEIGEPWDQVRPRLESSEEYINLESDELRLQAYEKHQKRLKDRERERAADERRNGHSRRSHGRTPELDPYEADRRKAQADRERNYSRKGAPNALGPSPPPQSRRGDRYEDYDGGYRDRDERDRRDSRKVSSSHYDRERREREAERERSYISRADPRDRGSVLDYGDETPVSATARKRRDSDSLSVRSGRDSKRLRRDGNSRERTYSPRGPHRRSRSPKAPPKQEEEDLKSGSEEGEIEEN